MVSRKSQEERISPRKRNSIALWLAPYIPLLVNGRPRIKYRTRDARKTKYRYSANSRGAGEEPRDSVTRGRYTRSASSGSVHGRGTWTTWMMEVRISHTGLYIPQTYRVTKEQSVDSHSLHQALLGRPGRAQIDDHKNPELAPSSPISVLRNLTEYTPNNAPGIQQHRGTQRNTVIHTRGTRNEEH